MVIACYIHCRLDLLHFLLPSPFPTPTKRLVERKTSHGAPGQVGWKLYVLSRISTARRPQSCNFVISETPPAWHEMLQEIPPSPLHADNHVPDGTQRLPSPCVPMEASNGLDASIQQIRVIGLLTDVLVCRTVHEHVAQCFPSPLALVQAI